ncbi:hypothetical protein ABSL23_11175 [Halobacterium sp. NMX12-1]|uniref:DUF8048 domain-containing protein n=1 Tax=Halobacterium sp. NMX12-1 TaxID=3166650 RepID=A0AAU8CGK4_9EURY
MLPFDDETVSRVAADGGVTEATLRDAAASVQATLSDYPGRSVDGLVYRRNRPSASGLDPEGEDRSLDILFNRSGRNITSRPDVVRFLPEPTALQVLS